MGSLRCGVIAAAVLLAAGNFLDASAGGLTLRQCIETAYGLSPALKAEQLDIDAAGQEIIRQRTALLPSVNASATMEYIDGYPVSPFSIATGEDLENGQSGGNSREVSRDTEILRTSSSGKTATRETDRTTTANESTEPRELHRADFAPVSFEHIELDYPLFQNGSILGLNDAPAVASARAGRQQLEWTRKAGEEKVVFDLCNAFFVAQWYQEKLARDEARVHFSAQRLDIVKLQFQMQMLLAQDVELAKSQLVADEATLAATKQSVRDSYAVLAVLIGTPPETVARLDGNAPKFPELPEISGLLARARTIHPAVGVQESVVEMARQKYRMDQAALLPAANFSTSYSLGENLAHPSTRSADMPGLYTAGISVNVPVFDWGSRLAEERESRVKVGAEEARADQVKMDVGTTIARLYDGIHDLERQLATAAAARVSADNAARLAREQRATGGLDQLTLVQSEEALLAAEDVEQNTRLTELEVYTQLEQAAGGAWRWTR